MRIVKDFVRSRPAMYDRVRSVKRRLLGPGVPSYRVLDEFSRARGGRVNFIQIGANDGLRNDPLRPFIVRDAWQGVLIEPLPTVFPLLKRNYAYLGRSGLEFVNAAVVTEGSGNLDFWTFAADFLDAQPVETRLDYLRKASFRREHVAGFLPAGVDAEKVLVRIPIPMIRLDEVVARYLPQSPLHLLAIDAEGYESTLIPGIDFSVIRPEAVFFESEHLGDSGDRVFAHLEDAGYRIQPVGGDSLAVLESGSAAG